MTTTYKPPCIVCGGEGCATSCASPRFVITTGGTYLGSTDVEAALRQLTIERDEARKERDDFKAKYEFMVERAANEKLDGYRELGQRAADAENARDKALAERDEACEELETLRALIEGETWAGAVVKRERDEARAERDDYLAEIERLHARVEHIDKSHAHAARFEAQHHAAELEDVLQQRNEALRALRQVLLSRDSAWKGGHDWQDALDEAASVYRRFGPKGI